MSKYEEIKTRHRDCKEKMSAITWKKFAINRIIKKCPICGKF